MNENLKKLEDLPPFEKLVKLMEILRSPNGCSWDREQTIGSLKKFVLEEAGEVTEAIEKGDSLHLCEELGDLLMIIVFVARVSTEAGGFSIDKVLEGIVQKLVFRHPHVFGDDEKLSTEGVLAKWKLLKAEEKKHKNRISSRMKESLGFSSPLHAACKIQQEAANPGFDFPHVGAALEKITEETAEISEALGARRVKKEAVSGEIGDLLFSVVNVARFAGIDPDEALKSTNRKFIDRFEKVEAHFEKKGGLAGRTIQELDAVWDRIKKGKKTLPQRPSRTKKNVGVQK